MIDFLARSWEHLVGRIDGPMSIRFILQPTMAMILALRAGLADARAGRDPYLWRLVKSRGNRQALVTEGLKDVSTLLVVALVLDVTYQVLELGFVYPLQTLIVTVTLGLVPYVLMRGPATRLARRLTKSRQPRG